MRTSNVGLALAFLVLFVPVRGDLRAEAARAVKNRNGATIAVIDVEGRAQGRPPAKTDTRGTTADPSLRTGSTATGSWVEYNVPNGRPGGRIRRVQVGPKKVDETGLVAPSEERASARSALANSVTIDRMTTGPRYDNNHVAGDSIFALGPARVYSLSDGSTWESGAGHYYQYAMALDHVEVSGNTVRYVLVDPGPIYEQTDFDSGEHSAQGTLAAAGPLVIEATIGSDTAVLHGNARVVSNEATDYGDRFNYYSALIGSVVPFEITYQLYGTTWQPDTFDQDFQYLDSGEVDFEHPVSVPQLESVAIGGPPLMAGSSSAQFKATGHFEGGLLRDVTSAATWSVEPAAVASVVGGLLTTQAVTVGTGITLHVDYAWSGHTAHADKTISVLPGDALAPSDAWPMHQANAQHSGALATTLEPETFTLRWQRTIGSGRELNPVTAADGKVFVSLVVYFNDEPALFTLDARDGTTLWSKNYGAVFSVNAPSYAYGLVYEQTGKGFSGTPLLHAYDANSGESIFDAPFGAQWERYLAPTIDGGTVYVDGGDYGGMYAFDAFSGQQLWFGATSQYDSWTPALDARNAYAYVGGTLFALLRTSGAQAFRIQDPNYDWNGYSMDASPVLGTHDDLFAIHDGRLLSFDLPGRSIRYELRQGFTGQPSVVHDTVYAIAGGALAALDEVSGTTLWSWAPPEGSLQGTLIVTDSHVIASTASATYAVDLHSHTQVWSYPVSGKLSLSEGTLYIASSTGLLTAISAPARIPATPDGIAIVGPTQATEGTSAQFRSQVHYADGRLRDRTATTEWSLAPAVYGTFGLAGTLRIAEVFDPYVDVVVHARYVEGEVAVESSVSLRLLSGLPTGQLIERDLSEAVSLKAQVLTLLEGALARERAARHAAATIPPSGSPVERVPLPQIRDAIARETAARGDIQRSIDDLRRALAAAHVITGPPSHQP